MGKSESKKLPEFGNVKDLVEFTETHDMSEFWGELPAAHFDVDIKERKYIFSINPEIAEKLFSFAQAKKISAHELIHSWLKEKLENKTSKK